MVIQDTYTTRQGIGYYGGIARPNTPTFFELGQVSDAVKPGYGVLFDDATEKWRLPDDASERLEVSGIVGFDSALKPNDSGVIEFEANSTAKIAVMGHFYAKAGEALKYGDLVVFDQVDNDWVKYDRTIAGFSAVAPNDFDATAPADYNGTVNAAGVSTYVQDAINGLDASVSAYVQGAVSGSDEAIGNYVRSAINSLPRFSIVAATKAASGGIVELRLSGAATR